MNDDELGRLLGDALAARTRAVVPDHAPIPPMRAADGPGRHDVRRASAPRHRRSPNRPTRWLAPLASAAAVLVLVVLGIVIADRSDGPSGRQAVGVPATTRTAPSAGPGSRSTSAAGSSSSAASSSAASSSAASSATARPVRVSLKFSDGSSFGVGMPIIAFLSRPITDARGFAAATSVTVNGKPARGGWYFERRFGDRGHPIEADWRMPSYWPGHARVHLDLAVKGTSAGSGLVFDNDLALDFRTGAANVVTVDDSTHTMTVVSDGAKWGSFPVSLGAADTRTRRGIKVIMEKGRSICMSGPGYQECGVKYTQRLTYDGEYLHAAPWNTANISRGVDSSNGCTNLTTSDAKRLFDFLEIGDVVAYPNADGPVMQLGDGYGVWNLSWTQWRTGGLYPTS